MKLMRHLHRRLLSSKPLQMDLNQTTSSRAEPMTRTGNTLAFIRSARWLCHHHNQLPSCRRDHRLCRLAVMSFCRHHQLLQASAPADRRHRFLDRLPLLHLLLAGHRRRRRRRLLLLPVPQADNRQLMPLLRHQHVHRRRARGKMRKSPSMKATMTPTLAHQSRTKMP